MEQLANDTNPWAPAEDSSTILAEHAWLQGVVLSAVAYGAEVVLFCMCFYYVYRQRTRETKWRSIALLAYISTLFILGTLTMASLSEFTQLAFIDNRNFEGGPNNYENTMFGIPVDEIGNASFMITNALCDGLIVWRCMAIYGGCRFPLWATMCLPCLLLLASTTMGILYLVQISTTGPFGSTDLNWTIPYFSLSLSLNILTTIAISLRLLIYRQRITRVMGPSYGSHYISIASMVVESASIYSAYSLFFLIPFALGSSISSLALQSLTQVQTCVTFLIIFRVSSGKSLGQKLQSTLSDIKAGVPSGTHAENTSSYSRADTISRVQLPMKRIAPSGLSITTFDKYPSLGPICKGSSLGFSGSESTRTEDGLENNRCSQIKDEIISEA